MRDLIFLSHELGVDTPGFGGARPFSIRPSKRISNGDSSNSDVWELSNHVGTHVDAPFHFSSNGLRITDFPPSFWRFEHPYLVDRPCDAPELLGVEPWCRDIPSECDLLLIRTGCESRRDEEAYWSSNPGLSAELAHFLRNERSKVRAVGVDFISITSFPNRELGRIAHRAFLDDFHAILLIEDMKLSPLSSSPSSVLVSPIRVTGTDGAPVTVFAERNS